MKNNNYILTVEAILFFTIFTIFVPIISIIELGDIKWEELAIGGWLIVVYSTTRMTIIILSQKPRVLGMTFWMFVYMFLGYTPFLQGVFGNLPWGGQYTNSEILKSFSIVVFGLIAFEIGSQLSWKIWGRGPRGFHMLLSRELDSRRSMIMGLVFTAIAAAIVVLLLGAENIFTARNVRWDYISNIVQSDGLSEALIIGTLLQIPVYVSFLALLGNVISRNGTEQGGLTIKVVVVIVLGIVTIIINNPFSTPRYLLGTVFISTLFMIYRWKGGRSYLRIMAIGLILFIVVFPFSDIYRRNTNVDIRETVDNIEVFKTLARKLDFDAFQQLVNAVQYVEKNDLSYGRQIVGAFLFFVPRTLWSSKPLPTGTMVADWKEYPFNKLSMPLWGEAYIDGGLFWLAFIFFLYGILHKRLEKYYLTALETGDSNYAYYLCVIFSPFQFFLLRGSLMSAIAYLTSIVFFSFFCTRKGAKKGMYVYSRNREISN